MTPNRYFYLVMFMIFVYMGLIVFLADCLVRVNDIIEDINYITCLNDKDCRTEQRIYRNNMQNLNNSIIAETTLSVCFAICSIVVLCYITYTQRNVDINPFYRFYALPLVFIIPIWLISWCVVIVLAVFLKNNPPDYMTDSIIDSIYFIIYNYYMVMGCITTPFVLAMLGYCIRVQNH